MKTWSRGDSESFTDGTNIVVQWKDSRNVICASNCNATKPMTYVKRFDRQEKKRVNVSIPHYMSQYNKLMGGVDLFDQSVCSYRIRLRSRKWYYPLISWCFNALMVNPWRFYQDLRNQNMSLLQFTREVVMCLLAQHGSERKRAGHSAKVSHSQNITVRYDGIAHWPIDTDIKGGRCSICSGRSKIRCKKCDVALHVQCFETYHVDSAQKN